MIDDKNIPKLKSKSIQDQVRKYLKLNPLKTKKINKPERILNMGIEQLKDAVVTVCSFTTAIVDTLEDGKVTIGDLTNFISPLVSLPAALTGIGEVPAELADLSEEEKAELIQLVKDELDLGDEAEEVIAKALTILYEIKALIDMLK